MDKILHLVFKSLSDKMLAKIGIRIAEKLAEKTDNEYDDEVVAILKEVFKELGLI